MTPAEFHRKMEKIERDNKDDPELAHLAMDELMCRVLQEQGFWSGVDVFKRAKKHYS